MAGKQVFKMPYIGISKSSGYDLLTSLQGEQSVVIKLTNPVMRFAASPSAYEEFHGLMTGIIKLLGDGHILQKQDMISRSKYPGKNANEYLQKQYNTHFAGRDYQQVATYLTITKQVKKGSFYVYDKKALRDFTQAIGKVMDILEAAKQALKY